MSSGFTLSLILLAVLAASLYFLVQAEGGWQRFPYLLERVGITIDRPLIPRPSPAAVLPGSFTSGDSRFSQGNCSTDANCQVSGCSGEVCGNQEVITTCEFSEDFPNARDYTCGCVKGQCGWRQK